MLTVKIHKSVAFTQVGLGFQYQLRGEMLGENVTKDKVKVTPIRKKLIDIRKRDN